ncbi:MAG: hypothetical protein ABSG43_28020 [Solirubrobacteraceae bacterium]
MDRCCWPWQSREQRVELWIDGHEPIWNGYEQARALAERAALQRWRVTRIRPGACDDD